jgi:ClpX C4-type zinc finger
MAGDKKPHCSFCGRTGDDVGVVLVIMGDTFVHGAAICNLCVQNSVNVLINQMTNFIKPPSRIVTPPSNMKVN